MSLEKLEKEELGANKKGSKMLSSRHDIDIAVMDS